MKTLKALTLGVVLIFSAAAPAWAAAPSAQAELAEFKRAIRAQYDLKEKAFARKDAAAIVNRFYAADVISTGEGEAVLVGREQIRPLYEKVVNESDVRIESVYTHVRGPLGWDWADFKVTPRDRAQAPFTFKILFLWEKVGEQWLCKGDMFLLGNMRNLK